MPTVISVHGTFASGPEDGEAWWQRGGAFDKRLRELVGDFQHIPFVWDGLNSETARRTAGRTLLDRMQALEASGTDYTVIGHSHGGSVIASALYAAALERNALPHMKLWMTVGTPFISHIRQRALFSRLSNVGKAGYMVVVYLLFSLLSFLGYAYYVEGDFSAGDVFLVLPFVVLYFVLRRMQVTDRRLYRRKYRRRARELFEPRWVGIRHEDDEALQGLGSLKDQRIDLFPPTFAVPTLSLASLFVLPLLLVLIARSPTAMQTVVDIAHQLDPRTDVSYFQTDGSGAPNFIKNGFLLLALPAYVMLSYFEQLGIEFWLAEPLSIALTLFLIVAVCWGVSLLVLYVVTLASRTVSAILSRSLNRASWAQIKRSVLGGNAVGETAVEVFTGPVWAEKQARCLPDYISNALISYSNQYAAQALAKFRVTLNVLAFQEAGGDSIGTISQYLTWRELIHTSYFAIPEFQSLAACALTRCGAFAPSAALRGVPEYDANLRWLAADDAPPKGEAIVSA